MSPEEKECIMRIISLLRSRSLSATELVNNCVRDDLLRRYKGHSSTTVYKAMRYLEHFKIIQKRPVRETTGRGRPPMMYKLRRSAVEVLGKDRAYSFGESFAHAMFKDSENLDSALTGYEANVGLFFSHFLDSAIVRQLKNLPLDTEENVQSLTKKLHEDIDRDCEELRVLANEYVNLILERFGT